MVKKMTDCAKGATLRYAEVSIYFSYLTRNSTRLYAIPHIIQDHVRPDTCDRSSKGGDEDREDMFSGSILLADDFVGISGTPEALQKQIEETLDYTQNGE